MEFLLTFFIYPLQEPLTLSKQLGFTLDNPRTDDEIEMVKEYLLRAYESGYDYTLPIHSKEDIVTVESILIIFRNALSEKDHYVKDKFAQYELESIFDFLASIWIIARFEDEGIGEALRKEHQEMREEGKSVIFLLDDDHPLVKNAENLANYCSLLSLLIHTEQNSYFGRSFLVESREISSDQPAKKVWREYLMFGIASQSYPESQDELRWIFFPDVKEKIVSVAELLERAFESGLKEKLLYVGSILKIITHEVGDIRTKIVMITSILELLLTHNPDFNRFNVEDSISKQFQLKASILVYLNDKTVDIDLVKKRLKTIYHQRSNIAHGNFSAVNKYINSLSKKEGKEEYFDDRVEDLYKYVRAVLEEYLKDSKFVEFLKEN